MTKTSKLITRQSEGIQVALRSRNANPAATEPPDENWPDSNFRVPGGPVQVLSEMPLSFALLDDRYRQRLYVLLSYVYEVASYLRSSEAAWKEFQNDPVWDAAKNRPQKEHRHTALQPVLRLAFGLGSKPSSKLASKHYAALAEAFRQEIPAAALPEFIEQNGGLETLARDEARRRRPTTQSIAQPISSTSDARVVSLRRGAKFRLEMEIPHEDHAVRLVVERILPQK